MYWDIFTLMHAESGKPEYIPGVCNIGSEETQRRYRYGYWGVLMSLLLILLLEGLNTDRIWRLVICIPAALAWTGLLQARHRFCLKYGLGGVFSIEGLRMITKVTGDEFLRQDRTTAIKLLLKIVAGTLLITLIYYFAPVDIFG